MSKPQITETASRRPGRCAISKDTNGPFLDTGENIPGFGHVYLSMRFLTPLLRDQGGFVPAEDIEDLEKENQELQNENAELRGYYEDLNQLIEAVTPYLPKPEPEVHAKTVVETRAPSDEEIEKWIKENGADHRVVRAARRKERGSTEQWHELYGDTKVTQPLAPTHATPTQAELSPAARARIEREDDEDRSGAAPQNVELFDQTVDLDVVLSQNVKDVRSFAEGKPRDFVRVLVEREFYLAEQREEAPRKGILEPLGFWDADKNEAVHPRVLDAIQQTESEDDAGDETVPDNLSEPGDIKKEVASRPETAGDVKLVEEGQTPEAGRASEEVDETPTEAEEGEASDRDRGDSQETDADPETDSEDSEEDDEEVDLSDLDEDEEDDGETDEGNAETTASPYAPKDEDFQYDDNEEEE